MASLGRTAGSFNAGILSGRKPWHTLTKAEVERFVEVNYVGYFLVTKAVYPLLKKSQTPRVIMVASRRIFWPTRGRSRTWPAKAR
jgi:NAD(P)-dependent dehydrogenase (short-subunit alcohol dehydrogenase family)